MSKIVDMTVGAIDPIAVTKRVFWRPVSTGTPLKVGDPVCYRLDFEDHKKRTANPAASHIGGVGTTYAEGAQSATSRLFCVEEPLIDNIGNFAGIVKCLGPEAGSDGDFIEIFKANSGAVVPANIVLTSTTAGRTILAVMVGTRTLGSPTTDCADFESDSDTDTDEALDSKVVGVAMENLTAAGKCWVKLDENAFMYQGGNVGQDFLVTSVGDDVTVNKMFLNIAVTAGHCQALHYRTVLTGTGGDAQRGCYRFDTIVRGVPADDKHVFGLATHLEIGSDFSTVNAGHVSPLKITLRTQNAQPNLSGVGILAAIHIDWILRGTTAGTTLANPAPISCIMYINDDSGGSEPTYFLIAEHAAVVCQSANAVNQDDNAALSIKVMIGSVAYHIPTFTDAEIGI